METSKKPSKMAWSRFSPWNNLLPTPSISHWNLWSQQEQGAQSSKNKATLNASEHSTHVWQSWPSALFLCPNPSNRKWQHQKTTTPPIFSKRKSELLKQKADSDVEIFGKPDSGKLYSQCSVSTFHWVERWRPIWLRYESKSPGN